MPSEEELMGLAAHMGMLRVLFQSKKKTAVMLSSSITSAAATVRLTEMIGLHRKKRKEKKKSSCKLTSKQKLVPVPGPSARFLSFTGAQI